MIQSNGKGRVITRRLPTHNMVNRPDLIDRPMHSGRSLAELLEAIEQTAARGGSVLRPQEDDEDDAMAWYLDSLRRGTPFRPVNASRIAAERYVATRQAAFLDEDYPSEDLDDSDYEPSDEDDDDDSDLRDFVVTDDSEFEDGFEIEH